jgi:hypothetical protein
MIFVVPGNGGLMDTPMYLRREGTDMIFVATDALLKRKDMTPYNGPVPFREESATEMPRLDGAKAGLGITTDEAGSAVRSSKGRKR